MATKTERVLLELQLINYEQQIICLELQRRKRLRSRRRWYEDGKRMTNGLVVIPGAVGHKGGVEHNGGHNLKDLD